MPFGLPDPFWPWLLGFGVLVLGLGWLAKDRRAQWTAGLWALGIILMQAPIVEPGRWLYAATLWTVLSVFVSLHVGNDWSAWLVWLIPIGYAALLLDGVELVALRTEGQNISFGITEMAGVVAVIAGSRGLPHEIFSALKRRSGIRFLAGRRVVVHKKASPP